MISFSGTEKISNLIDLEKVSLDSTLDIQKSLNKQILVFMKKFMTNIDLSSDIVSNDKTFFYLSEAATILSKSNLNICTLNGLLSSLAQINSSNENLENMIKSYNTNFKTSMKAIYENTEIIEKFIHKVVMDDSELRRF